MIYDLGGLHAVHTMTSRCLLFATPVEFAKKVPPLFFVDQGPLSLSITLSAAGYFLQTRGLVPLNTHMPCEVPLLLTFLFAPSLAAHFFCFLMKSISFSVCFTSLPVAFNAVTHSVANNVKDTDNLYIADLDQWFADICDGKKLTVLIG